jgi:Carboxypeptidase regulatory-like domain
MTQASARQTDRPSAVRCSTLRAPHQSASLSTLARNIWRPSAIVLPLLISSMLLFPHRAFAQEFRGTIGGTVTDPRGAMVPGASVQVVEMHTGTISRTISDGAGQYTVPFLSPGDYSITVTAPGFQTLTRRDVTLQAQDHLEINLALRIGRATQAVTVTSQVPLLNVANSSVGDVIESKSVQDLPINGRTPEMLAELAVSVSLTTAPHLVRPYDVDAPWSIAGGTEQGSNGENVAGEVLLDGGPDLDFDGGTAYSAPQDAVQEVSVQPFDTDAAYGHTISGVVNMITKSGTNSYHGIAYEFSAVNPLNANSFFDDRNNPVTPLSPNHYNQYGINFGGPIWIPRVVNLKNKLFFYFAWEGGQQREPEPTVFTVPTAAERAGDFSALLAGGSSYQIFEPDTGTLNNGKYSRTPVPNNCLTNQSTYCSSVANAGITIDPVAAAYMKLYPLPNYTAGVSPITNEDNYTSSSPDTLAFNSFFGRMDYNASARDHVFFDMRHNYGYFTEDNYLGNSADGYANPRWNWGTTLDNVFTLNPTTVFDMRFNSTVHTNNEFQLSGASGFNPTSVGFPSYMQSASDFETLPEIKYSTFENFASNSSTKLSTFDSYQIFVDMMKIKGKHTLKIGLDARQYLENQFNPADSSGDFTEGYSFVNGGTGAANQPCCAELAEMEYGLANSGDFQLIPLNNFRTYYVAAFVQDDWRVNNHLMLNIGVRYDIDTPWGEEHGRTVSGWNPTAVNSASAAASAAFSPTTVTVNGTAVSVSSINTLGGLTFPTADWGAPYQIQDKRGFWSPRLGFSYNPARFKNTVLRGGFGLFDQPQTISSSDDAGYLNAEGFSASTAFAATSNSNFTYINKLDNPFPSGFVQPVGSADGASTFLGSPSSISFLAPVEHDLYAVRWTLGLQQQLPGDTLIELTYQGTHGLHLPVNNNINSTELQYLTTNPYRNQNLSTAYGTAVANPFAGLLPNGSSSYNGATTSLSNLLVPYPAYGSASITEEDMTIGQSSFEAGMLHLEHRSKHGFTLMANYQYGKAIEQDTYLNPEDAKLFRGDSAGIDFRHHFNIGGTYDLPFGRGKLFSLGDNSIANQLAGGWVLNGVYLFQTGLPIDFSADIPLQPGMTIHDIKSNPSNASPTVPALSTNVFVTGSGTCTVSSGQPCDGTVFFNGQYVDHYRTLPLTMGWVRAAGYNNLDSSLLKNFPINSDGSRYLQFRFETFNTLNHPQLAAPNVSSATSSTFGYITGIASKSISRQVQIGGRFIF